MPGRRGYEQIYCSPRCRRAEGKRREAAKYAIQQPVKPMRGHEPHNEPHYEPMNDEWGPYVDDLCRANWEAHAWRIRYHKLKEQHNQEMAPIIAAIERLERRMDDI